MAIRAFPSRRPGRPATLTDVTRVEVEDTRIIEESPAIQRRRSRPTLEEQHLEALQLALDAEANVRARRAQIREELRQGFYARRQTLPISLDLMVDKYTSDDGIVGYNIGQNQWQISRATMFGLAVTVRQNAKLIEQNEKIINLLTAQVEQRDNA